MSAINRRSWSYLVTIGTPLFQSAVRWRAYGALVLILLLLLSLNGLNVVNSYVGRGFMSAIAERETMNQEGCASALAPRTMLFRPVFPQTSLSGGGPGDLATSPALVAIL
jgi:hypothetical protein